MTETKEYIIHYQQEQKALMDERLAAYKPTYFEFIPYCAVRIDVKHEASLLEALTTIPGITYREALTRKTLHDRP